jgi:hypothetical protein
MPSSFQYPIERHRDLQRRWGRLLPRTAVPHKVRNKYYRAEEDHDRLGNAIPRRARDRAAAAALTQNVIDRDSWRNCANG